MSEVGPEKWRTEALELRAEIERLISIKYSYILTDKEQKAEIERLRALLSRVIRVNDDFRSQLPADWEGDPMDDLCKEITAALQPKEGEK